ncbi:DNA polymerase II [archaeon]|nr:DNA polymerase II [archaeon]MBT4417545.1 DNA polymerase II [archaeon]
MKGFILYSTYRIIRDKAYVALFGRLENGENFVTFNLFRPYFFIRKKDLKEALELEEFEYKNVKLKNFLDEPVVKVILDLPGEVPKLRKILIDEGIKTYEADMRFTRRFLIDKQITSTVDIDGDYDSEENIDRVYKDPELKACDCDVKLKVMSVDIETDPTATDLYCIGIKCGKYKKVLLNHKKKIKHCENFSDEEDVLERFMEVVKEEDPDVIVGWNFINFDIKFIFDKCKEYKIPFNLGRDNSVSKTRFSENFMIKSKVDVVGRMVLDGIDFLKDNFVKLKDYKLETVGQHYVGQGKKAEIVDWDNLEKDFKKNPTKLVEYNIQDVELVLDILDKSELLDLTVKRSKLTGMRLNEVGGSVAPLDYLYLTKLRGRGYVGITSLYSEKMDKVKGAYVMEGKVGIYDEIICLDFKSLYSSVIRTFNLDPLAFSKKEVKTPFGTKFAKKEGVLPEILDTLWQVREGMRKRKDETGRYAVKTTMNSFWGALANTSSRYFSMDLANSITGNARFVIQEAIKFVQAKKYEVIYSDTDSMYVVAKKDASKEGKKLEKDVNDYFKKLVKQKFKRESFLELEFEKVYTKFLMPKLRGGTKGAKKRYAGLVKGKLEVVGMEAVRGDWTGLARRFQMELLVKVFKGEKLDTWIRKFVADFKKGKFDDELVYRKGLRKPLDEYRVNPPHVKAARKVKGFNSAVVEYIITEDGPECTSHIKHKLDYKHYLDKQIKPIANTVLELLGKDFDELLQGQKTLF